MYKCVRAVAMRTCIIIFLSVPNIFNCMLLNTVAIKVYGVTAITNHTTHIETYAHTFTCTCTMHTPTEAQRNTHWHTPIHTVHIVCANKRYATFVCMTAPRCSVWRTLIHTAAAPVAAAADEHNVINPLPTVKSVYFRWLKWWDAIDLHTFFTSERL